MDQTLVAAIRAFNRFYSRVIGALDAGMHETAHSLAEARLIYELGTRRHATHGELARVLDIDPGYLTRLNFKLVEAGLVASAQVATDRRSNHYALTRDGEQVFATLDHASDVAVEAMLQPLDRDQRLKLVAAMSTIGRLLGQERDAPAIVLRPHRVGELGWLIHRQGVLYNQQFGWNGEFEALIAGLYRDFEAFPPSPPKALWVADQGGSIVGSIYVVPSEGMADCAQLRMLYVEPEARGQGLGRTLVDQAIGFARGSGYGRMRLWTQSVLVSARRIYEAAGFALVETKPHHSFGKDLDGETWELVLQ